MPLLLILIGVVILLYGLSRLQKQSHSATLRRLLRYGFAGILALGALFILIRGNISISGILGVLSYLSARGNLWNVFGQMRGASGKTGPQKPASLTTMTREEALEILGLSGRPDRAEIKAAHHKMMLKFHPDQGGSDYFAIKLNQARDLLS